MSTQLIDIKEAQINFRALLDAAVNGEEFVIMQDDRPVVRLVPITVFKPKRRAGSAKGQISTSSDFNDSYEYDSEDLP